MSLKVALERADYDVFQGRVSLSSRRKLALMGSCLGQVVVPAVDTSGLL